MDAQHSEHRLLLPIPPRHKTGENFEFLVQILHTGNTIRSSSTAGSEVFECPRIGAGLPR